MLALDPIRAATRSQARAATSKTHRLSVSLSVWTTCPSSVERTSTSDSGALLSGSSPGTWLPRTDLSIQGHVYTGLESPHASLPMQVSSIVLASPPRAPRLFRLGIKSQTSSHGVPSPGESSSPLRPSTAHAPRASERANELEASPIGPIPCAVFTDARGARRPPSTQLH